MPEHALSGYFVSQSSNLVSPVRLGMLRKQAFAHSGLYKWSRLVNSSANRKEIQQYVAYQLGLDTGGTYTDAVLVDDERNVVGSAKSLTTHHDLAQGLKGAVDSLLTSEQAADIQLVCLSTTLATNALVEGRGRSVGLVLVGFTPDQMKRARLSDALAGDPHVFVQGGHSAGGQPLCELDAEACRQFVESVDGRVDAYAVSAVFSVRNPAHEAQLQRLIANLTGKPVSCGHHLSSGLDAPRRALTALLNARLIPTISALLQATRSFLDERHIKAPLMVVKGDGSLISDEMALRYPVETILSGPAASVVGAQFLCRDQNLLVSDMGGTTTDVALIRDGQPRLNLEGATVGGWRTMVKAVDVRTYGLGGDSAVVFDRDLRQLKIGPNRVVPLSLLTLQYPALLDVLEAQLALPRSETHSAQFVMSHGNAPDDLTYQQRELYQQISKGPIALQTLFKDQTLERALSKLEHRGVILRSGFTPSDACHLVGRQTDWQRQGALLGAQLLMRYSSDNLGAKYADIEAFAEVCLLEVSKKAAMILMDTAAVASGRTAGLTESQQSLLRQSLDNESGALLSLHARLHLPIVALGAPAQSYYAKTSELLNTQWSMPNYASVANALGAVVGTIRQEQIIMIAPAGGKKVSVLFPTGPETFNSLEEGAAAATELCSVLATDKAKTAGADDITVTLNREDSCVTDGGQPVFFESRVTATAVGRPALAM